VLGASWIGHKVTLEYIARQGSREEAELEAVLTWVVQVHNYDTVVAYEAFVDAHSGELIGVYNLVAHASVSSIIGSISLDVGSFGSIDTDLKWMALYAGCSTGEYQLPRNRSGTLVRPYSTIPRTCWRPHLAGMVSQTAGCSTRQRETTPSPPLTTQSLLRAVRVLSSTSGKYMLEWAIRGAVSIMSCAGSHNPFLP